MFVRKFQPGPREATQPTPQLGPVHIFLRRVVLPCLICCLPNTGLGGYGQAPTVSEYQLKASISYSFINFVEWPADSFGSHTTPLVLGVLGDDPFDGALDQLIRGKNLNGRPVTVKHFKWGQNLRECHLLFISAAEQKRLPQILANLRGSSVLTVSDINSFCQQGGAIELVLENNKVRVIINVNVAEQSRLHISSKLLSLAKLVIGDRRLGKN